MDLKLLANHLTIRETRDALDVRGISLLQQACWFDEDNETQRDGIHRAMCIGTVRFLVADPMMDVPIRGKRKRKLLHRAAVGYCSFGVRQDEQSIRLLRVGVYPGLWRLGIGGKLVEYLQSCTSKIVCFAQADNLDYLLFLRANGFKREDGDDELYTMVWREEGSGETLLHENASEMPKLWP